GLENQFGVLGLVLNCVVLWTTVYLDAEVRQLPPAPRRTFFGRDSQSGSYECSPAGDCQARVCRSGELVKTDE
ncbi:hypothetical protein ACWCSH_36595, partial [Streptosporangium sp. NPDC001682]